MDKISLNNLSKSDALLLQNYGFCSAIPKNSQVAVIFVGGHNEAGVVIASDSTSYRDTELEEGEVKIYTKFGSSIKLNKSGGISVDCKNFTVSSEQSIDFISPQISFRRK